MDMTGACLLLTHLAKEREEDNAFLLLPSLPIAAKNELLLFLLGVGMRSFHSSCTQAPPHT